MTIPPPVTPPPKPDEDADEGDGVDPNVKPGMSLQEIKDAGLQVDLPFESGSADPQPLQYADLGPEKQYKGEGKIKFPTTRPSWDEA